MIVSTACRSALGGEAAGSEKGRSDEVWPSPGKNQGKSIDRDTSDAILFVIDHTLGALAIGSRRSPRAGSTVL